ncbi:MAG TPA: polysaccharide biosynthesis/export family protein [Vicinamibacterales bacterium]|nr:polysaccharide biosynthesis/export family protein [Vicinamibacterales bacterium]
MKRVIFFVTFTLFSAASQTLAQTPAAAAPSPSAASPAPAPLPAAATASPQLEANTYRLGPDDEIALVVVGEDDFNHNFRVQSDGNVTLPWIGQIPARGLTAGELQERIRVALSTDWIRNPQVRVEISKYSSQSVIVQGEVRLPGKVPMTGPMTLMEALVAAGSPTPNASSVVTVARRPVDQNGQPTAGDAINISVNLDDLRRGVAGADIPLRGNDIVNVPKAETFYVQGRVKNVGVYVWEPGLTVAQAITKAGGLDDRGRDSGLKATRLVNGKPQEVDIKLTDLVRPNDIIIVPQRRF